MGQITTSLDVVDIKQKTAVRSLQNYSKQSNTDSKNKTQNKRNPTLQEMKQNY